MRELMNIVFYISVSFLCSFTKISISKIHSQIHCHYGGIKT